MSKPSTPRKPRPTTRELLGPNWDDSLYIPNTPRPGKVMSDYSTENIKERLAYASNRRNNPKRKLTPLGEAALRRYEDACKDSLLAKTDEDRIFAASIPRRYERSIGLEKILDVSHTDDQQELIEKIGQWRIFEYHARYGAYLAIICNNIKEQARVHKTQDFEELHGWKKYWTDIAAKLNKEEPKWRQRKDHFVRVPLEEIKTWLAVDSACDHIGLDCEMTVQMIFLYADRNSMVHKIEGLIENCKWSDLAKLLHRDLMEIEAVIPENLQWSIYLYKQLIGAQIKEFFDIDGRGNIPDEPTSWTPKETTRERADFLRKLVVNKAEEQENLKQRDAMKWTKSIKMELENRVAFMSAFKGSDLFKQLSTSSTGDILSQETGSSKANDDEGIASGELPDDATRKCRQQEDFLKIMNLQKNQNRLMKAFCENYPSGFSPEDYDDIDEMEV